MDEAVEEYLAMSRAAAPQRQEPSAAVEAEISKTEQSLDRYFNAFEAGKMNEDLCQPRIEALAQRLRELRARHSELTAALEDEALAGPSADELAMLRAKIRDAIEHGPITLRKAVLQELVVEVRVESRNAI